MAFYLTANLIVLCVTLVILHSGTGLEIKLKTED